MKKALAGLTLMSLLAATLLAATLLALSPASLRAAPDAAFTAWLASQWPAAQKLGVSRATFDIATRGVEPDYALPDLVLPGREQTPPRGQAEFVQTPAAYLSEKNLASLAAQGRALLAKHRDTLAGIEQRFGVPGPVVLAIWGRETAFGTYKLPYSAIRVLATQAFVGKRKEMFAQEFLLALKMLEDREVTLADMRSSWGGAMGLTQFLPSEFYKQAVDFDGDGHRDIWRSVPDALASAAKQLAEKGWQAGKPWAYEVKPPRGVDCTTADPDNLMSLEDWTSRGFARSRGTVAPREREEKASLLMPAGVYGPSFLILKNYYVIKDYNFSDLYVLFVGNLADRIAGGGPFDTPWSAVTQLRTADLEAMQKRLTQNGLYRDKIDGKAGMRTRLALGAYQKANGLPLDCWPTQQALDHMRSSAAR